MMTGVLKSIFGMGQTTDLLARQCDSYWGWISAVHGCAGCGGWKQASALSSSEFKLAGTSKSGVSS